VTAAHDPAYFALVAMCVVLLMTFAGTIEKRLGRRHTTCPVCHRATRSCTCRWL
jgi:hypothetical protein